MTRYDARKLLRVVRPDLADTLIVAIKPNKCGIGYSVIDEHGGSIDLVSGRYTLPPQQAAERFGGDER